MSSRTVVIVDPYSSGSMLAPAFRKHGFTPVAVTTSAEPPPVYESSFQPDDFGTRLTSTGDVADLVARLRDFQPAAVIPGAETGVELADQLAAALAPRFANSVRLSAARRHKGEMERVVAARGLPTIRTICTSKVSEVEEWLAREGLEGHDLVLKPSRSAGTDGLAFAPSGRGWSDAFESLLGTIDLYGFANEDVLVQEFLTGTEYVVDTFSVDGVHTVSDICRYGKLSSSEHIAIYESIEFVPYDLPEHNELIAYVESVLDALDIRFGAAHTEVMLTEAGPRLIETGARLAGGGLPWTCGLATGENSIDRMIRTINGDSDIRKDFTLILPVLVVFFVCQSSGVVRNVEVLESIRELASFHGLDVMVRNGDTVQATTTLRTTMQLGWATLANTDVEQLHADHQAVREIQQKLVVEQG